MRIKEIEIEKYKSIKEKQKIDFTSQLIIFVGKNGSGKTNILDAIHTIFSVENSDLRKYLDYKFYIEVGDKDIEKNSSLKKTKLLKHMHQKIIKVYIKILIK
ncbi:AAA family ATPase [Haploplasma axanthum]|uniref:Putative ABC transporter ATP-binding protein P n=1 Tax=Haploplasma axanthum TaxID=29552 RepID=A0A449BC03_HAPAX|nr:AAA family ATPase [Haploplasma axanthum]VEU79973.1 putative ABC transporter ATP-binding protein P [Haploplasma axanthum]